MYPITDIWTLLLRNFVVPYIFFWIFQKQKCIRNNCGNKNKKIDPQGQDEVNGDLNVFDKSDDDDSDKEAKSSKPATAPKAKPANGDVGTSAKTKAKPSTSQQKGAKTKKNPVSNDSEDSSSPNKAFSFSSDSDDDKPITARGKNDGGKKKNFRMDIYSSSGSDFEDKPPVKKQQQQKKQTNVKPRVATKKSAGDAQNKASTHSKYLVF